MTEPPPIDMERIRNKIREMETKLKIKSKPLPKAPGELWPGESMDLGGWTLASRKRRVRRQAIG